MKLAAILLATAAALAAAQETPPATVTAADNGAAGAGAPTTAPTAGGATTPATTTKAPSAGSAGNSTTGGGAAGAAGGVDLKAMKAKSTGNAYQMAPIRVVHARAQSDTPSWEPTMNRFVSPHGGNTPEEKYRAAMDSVNTASVEGALMFVQAECIDVTKRDDSERCVRKNKVNKVVFYELLIAQTNETIAQFEDNWETPEYGPMIPMDTGRCTALVGEENFPPGCLQFNGEKGQPNIGPFVGGGSKFDDPRAPWPGNYWFSFPNTCPTKIWRDKTDECRKSTRSGLCPPGVAPNGVDCTFTYNILGWVPLDEVVGITNMVNQETGEKWNKFEDWCKADKKNIEFQSDDKHNKVAGLSFWDNPTDKEANLNRSKALIEAYEMILENKASVQVESIVLEKFKPLPKPADLAKDNPPCYKSVRKCATAPGCKRDSYAQLCVACKEGEGCETGDGKFTFPKLAKAPTKLDEKETKTDTKKVNDGMTTPDGKPKDPKAKGADGKSASSAASVTLAAAGALTLLVSALAL